MEISLGKRFTKCKIQHYTDLLHPLLRSAHMLLVLLNWLPLKLWIATVAMLVNDIHEINVHVPTPLAIVAHSYTS